MRTWPLVLLLLTAGLARGASVSPKLAGYAHCLSTVEAHAAWYARWIPAEILPLDRKLARMSEAVPILRENLALMVEKSHTRGLTPVEGLMMGNAEAACRDFQAALDRTGNRALALVTCVELLVGLLVVGTFPSWGDRAKPRPSPREDAPPSPDLEKRSA